MNRPHPEQAADELPEVGTIEGITTEPLKADLTSTVNVLHDLFRTIWYGETVPADWSKNVPVRLAKQGDLTECGNWRGITLMHFVAKVMGKVVIRRIADGVDEKLRRDQAVF